MATKQPKTETTAAIVDAEQAAADLAAAQQRAAEDEAAAQAAEQQAAAKAAARQAAEAQQAAEQAAAAQAAALAGPHRYRVISPLSAGAQIIHIGDEVMLTKEQAAPLLGHTVQLID